MSPYCQRTASINDVVAFDTGPGNMIIDRITGRAQTLRNTLTKAANSQREGKIHDSLLATLLAHPYLSKPPPKTTGREEFGKSLLTSFTRDAHSGIKDLDILATVTAFTARTIADSYKQWILSNINCLR